MLNQHYLTELQQLYNRGGKAHFLFFWGHTPRQHNAIDKSSLSNWFPARFEADQRIYATSEHYLMAHKAWLFGDSDTAETICSAQSSIQAKQSGRQVKGFDEGIWLRHRWRINLEANWLKFSQNPELAAFLIGTGTQILVEASPEDRSWGIGLSAQDPRAQDPRSWLGSNLLGFALMEIRQRLINQNEL